MATQRFGWGHERAVYPKPGRTLRLERGFLSHRRIPINGHRRQQHRSPYDIVDIRRRVHQVQAVVDQHQKDGSDDRADHGACPPTQLGTAQDDGGDHRELDADADTRLQQPPAADKHRGGNAILGLLRELALVPPIVALIVIGAYVDGNFLTLANLATILGASAALSLLVLGESLIIITGKFDLTLESNVGITPALGAMLVIPAASAGFGTEWPVALALSCTLLAGAIIGILNGFMIVKLKLNAFIVTLAMLIVLRGLHVGVTEGQTLWDKPSSFFWLATKTFLWMPISVWLALIVFICAGVFMRYHRTGRAIYAIGGNAEAARAAGIHVERITMGVFIFAGILAAVAGIILTGYVGAISASQGQGMIFTVFAAAVIGGISLDGGKGSMIGALTGVLLLGIVQNILTLAQVPSFWIQAIYGLIILGSLMIARITNPNSQ